MTGEAAPAEAAEGDSVTALERPERALKRSPAGIAVATVPQLPAETVGGARRQRDVQRRTGLLRATECDDERIRAQRSLMTVA